MDIWVILMIASPNSVAGADHHARLASRSRYVVKSSECDKRRLRGICPKVSQGTYCPSFRLPFRLPSPPTPRRRARSLYFFFSPCRSRLPFFLLVHARHIPVHAGGRAAIHHYIFIIIDQRAIPECCDARRRTSRAFSPGARRGRQCNGRGGTLRRRVRARG